MRLTSTTTRLLACAAALFALALLGAGCGDDSGSGGGDESEISALVEESVAFEDPATVCEDNLTEKALKDNYEGDSRKELLDDCSDDGAGEVDEVEVTDVKVDGDKGTADVSITEDDETQDITVEVVNDGGWRVDGVR